MILAIDTSTEQASIALAHEATIRAEWSWTAGKNHSRHLIPTIGRLLEIENQTPADLTALVVARGPGSFSGVRVGISAAKGMAMALRIPLVGISTLDVLAFQAAPFCSDVWAVMPAGRGDVYLARYTGSPENWQRSSDYLLLPADQARSKVREADLIVGPGAALLIEDRGDVLFTAFAKPSPWQLRRAGYLAELGRRYLQAGGHDQLDTLEPLYLRPTSAEEKRAAMCRE